MKILGISEHYFEVSGILVTNRKRFDPIKAFIKNVFYVLVLGPFLCGTSGAFIYLHHDQFEKCMQSFIAICGGILATGKYLSLKLNAKQIKMMMETFQQTVNKGSLHL